MRQLEDETPGRSEGTMLSLEPKLRRPPAFQTYASDDLASASYYTLSLAERGLLDAMRRVIWCDDSIPGDSAGIALAIRRSEPEVRSALTERVLLHFQPNERDPSRLICRELHRQLDRQRERRRRQSDAAEKTNAAKRNGNRNGNRDSNRGGASTAPEQSRTEQNPSIEKDVAPTVVDPDETAEYKRAFGDPPIGSATTAAAYRQDSGR